MSILGASETSLKSVLSVFEKNSGIPDTHPERKRDNPLDLCNLCSKNITTDIRDSTDANHERKRDIP